MSFPIEILKYHILPMRKEIIIYDFKKKYIDERDKINIEFEHKIFIKWGKVGQLRKKINYSLFVKQMNNNKDIFYKDNLIKYS
jgi:hypothetical protein